LSPHYGWRRSVSPPPLSALLILHVVATRPAHHVFALITQLTSGKGWKLRSPGLRNFLYLPVSFILGSTGLLRHPQPVSFPCACTHPIPWYCLHSPDPALLCTDAS
jgi:hypothetical protein